MELTFIAEIVEGEDGLKKLRFNNAAYYQTKLQKTQFGKVSVVISDKKPKRSLAQNSLLWVFYQAIAEETGNNAMEIHEYCKRHFLKPRIIQVKGEVMKISGSTTKLNKSEFSEYIMEIEAWSGIECPKLEDVNYIPNK